MCFFCGFPGLPDSREETPNAGGLKLPWFWFRHVVATSEPIRFQVFFLSLVRPKGGMQDWSALKEEYDKRYGFPAPEMSAALFEMFSASQLLEMSTSKWDEPPISHRYSLALRAGLFASGLICLHQHY